MKKVEMPKMGDTMEEGKILRWIKKEGDPVKKGEMLAEVETDKVNIEIEARMNLYLRTLAATELQKPLLHVSPGNTHPGTGRAYLPRFFPQLLPRRPHLLPLLSQAKEGVSSSRLLHVA